MFTAKLFVYNKFMMQKLIKRTVFPEHSRMLAERSEKMFAELKAIADEGFWKVKADYERIGVRSSFFISGLSGRRVSYRTSKRKRTVRV